MASTREDKEDEVDFYVIHACKNLYIYPTPLTFHNSNIYKTSKNVPSDPIQVFHYKFVNLVEDLSLEVRRSDEFRSLSSRTRIVRTLERQESWPRAVRNRSTPRKTSNPHGTKGDGSYYSRERARSRSVLVPLITLA